MIIFPRDEKTKYYKVHYQYILNILKRHDVIELGPPTALDTTRFVITIDGQEVLIDFSDFPDVYHNVDKYKVCFKFHCNDEILQEHTNIHPIIPVSFYDWYKYYELEREIRYTCNTDRILCNQRPYAGALERRKYVQALLKQTFQGVDTRIYPQEDFWKLINECLVSVCVPGARNDMLDRGQLQQMAFGCCTISPYISDIFINVQDFDKIYIQCANDYSDLVEKIAWCKENRDECIRIGQNAKMLFEETSTPERLWQWINLWIK